MPDTVGTLTSAVAPVVMVSAAGLLLTSVQAKNLHLADRIRTLMTEYRAADTAAPRRDQLAAQLRHFYTRIRLSQWSLDMLYVSILCFVTTSFLLASQLLGPHVGARTLLSIFAVGVAVLVAALGFEFVEMSIALDTIRIEMRDVTSRDGTRGSAER
jgi:hypothetical protein